MTESSARFASYFQRVGKSDVDVEVRRLMLSYLNGIQVNPVLATLGNLARRYTCWTPWGSR